MTRTITINDTSLSRFTPAQFKQLEEMAVIFTSPGGMYVRYVHVTRKNSSAKAGRADTVTITEGYGKYTGKKTLSAVKAFVNSSKANSDRVSYADNASELNTVLRRVAGRYSKSLDTAAYGYLALDESRKQSESKKQEKAPTAPRKRLRKKQYKQVIVPGTNKEADRARAAKDVGWRISASGRRYFENRSNRSDTEKEQKYHGGVNRRTTPQKKVKQTSTRASRSMKTTRRVAPVRKRDPQKRFLKIVNKITPAPDNYTGIGSGTIKYYEPKQTKRILSKSEFEALIIREMRDIDTRKIEHGVGIDKYGNIRFRSVGDSKSTKVPGGAWWKQPEIREAEVLLIHNHPTDGNGWVDTQVPLSEQDIKVATQYGYYNCKGIIACAKGRYYGCMITSPDALTLTPSGAKGQTTRLWNEAENHINETYPGFEGQKPGETYNEYMKRWDKYRHERQSVLVNLASKKFSQYFISIRGYRYIDKRY